MAVMDLRYMYFGPMTDLDLDLDLELLSTILNFFLPNYVNSLNNIRDFSYLNYW
jgi:hypothetical protein